MHEWEETSLEVHLKRITYGFTNPMPTTEIGPFMITARDINGGRILFETARRTSPDAFKSLTDKSRPNIGDVLVTKDGSLGRIAVVDRADICINQSVALLQPGPTIRSRFLKYLLEEPRNFARMLADADGTTIKHIYITRLGKMPVRVPSLAVQDILVRVLGSLDDKIELNRRMNETLEAMAQAIFRDWFVDFGPTRRKMDGATDPVVIMGGLVTDAERAQNLADLFPASLGDDGLPVGWKEAPLQHLGMTAIGGLWGNDNFDEEAPIRFLCLRGVDLEHLRETGHAPKVPTRFAKQAAVEKRMLSDRDVLIASSGAGPCGRPLWIGVDGVFPKAMPMIYSNFVKKITCRNAEFACYLDRILHNMRLSGEISAFIGGTSVPNLNEKNLLSTKFVVLPPIGVLSEFLNFALLIQEKLFSFENQTLAATRDLLLPKLMNGEIRLGEAEEMVEAAQ